MSEWLQSSEYAAAFLWVIGALVLLIAVLVLVRLIRSMTFGTFVPGGRNRKTRLAVMDATAVDSHRRLILVRRDDIEHLLLVGGPTDVVVEQNIRLNQPRQAVPAGDPGHEAAPQPLRPAAPARPPAQPPAAQLASSAPAPQRRYAESLWNRPLPTLQSLRATLWPENTMRHLRKRPVAEEPAPEATPSPDYGLLRNEAQHEAASNGVRDLAGKPPRDNGRAPDSGRGLDNGRAPDNAPRPGAKEPLSLEDEMNRLLNDLTSRF